MYWFFLTHWIVPDDTIVPSLPRHLRLPPMELNYMVSLHNALTLERNVCKQGVSSPYSTRLALALALDLTRRATGRLMWWSGIQLSS